MPIERDRILQLDDGELSRLVDFDFVRGSGNGGQKRNKTSNSVRVTLSGTSYSASDCSSRSQHRNRSAALRKLRLLLALNERREPVIPEQKICALDNAGYPLFAARMLDILDALEGDYRRAAECWGISSTAFLRRLRRDAQLTGWLKKNYPDYFVRRENDDGTLPD